MIDDSDVTALENAFELVWQDFAGKLNERCDGCPYLYGDDEGRFCDGSWQECGRIDLAMMVIE